MRPGLPARFGVRMPLGLPTGLAAIVLAATLFCCCAGNLPGPKDTERYNRALRLYEAKEYQAAMKEAKPLTIRCPRWPEGLLLYAKCARATTSIEGRRAATEILKRMKAYWPDRADVKRELASLYLEQGFDEYAKAQYDALAKAEANTSDAHYALATFAQRDWVRFGKPADLSRVIAELTQAVEADSTNLAALRRLTIAYMEKEDIPSMERTVTRLTSEASNDPAGLMLSAIVLHRKGRYEEALVRWGQFFSVSDSSTRAAFDDISLLLLASEFKEFKALEGEARDRFVRRFWKRLDPTPVTTLNERVLEHWYRVGISSALFSDSEAGIPGWRTEPGQMLIRYGVPRLREYVLRASSLGQSQPPALMWHYSDEVGPFKLAFVDRGMNGTYTYFSFSKPLSDLGDRPYYQPSTYQHNYGAEAFETFLAAAGFLRGSGVRVEFYVAVPLDKISKGDWRRVPLELAVFDTLWNEVTAVKTTLEGAKTFAGGGPGAVLVRELALDLEPNRYIVAVSVTDSVSGVLGNAKEVFDVLGFRAESLAVSDIELAYVLPESRLQHGISKAADILPNPTARYVAPEPLRLYYEVYNLSKDEHGKFRFAAKYSIVPCQKKGSSFWEFVASTASPGRHYIVSGFRRQVVRPSTSEQLTIDVSELTDGYYSLVMEITDSVSRQTVTTHATFERTHAATTE